jgi:hypothetical protein
MREYRGAIRGTITKIYKMCNNKKCGCHTTNREKHGVAYYISSSHKKRTKMLYIPLSMLGEAEERTKGWKVIMELMEEVSSINREIFKREKGLRKKGGKK